MKKRLLFNLILLVIIIGHTMEFSSDDYQIIYLIQVIAGIIASFLFTYVFYNLKPASDLSVGIFSLIKGDKTKLTSAQLQDAPEVASSFYQSFLTASFYSWAMLLLIVIGNMNATSDKKFFVIHFFWMSAYIICFFFIETILSWKLRWIYSATETKIVLTRSWITYLKVLIFLGLASFILDYSQSSILKEVFIFTFPLAGAICLLANFLANKTAMEGKTQ